MGKLAVFGFEGKTSSGAALQERVVHFHVCFGWIEHHIEHIDFVELLIDLGLQIFTWKHSTPSAKMAGLSSSI